MLTKFWIKISAYQIYNAYITTDGERKKSGVSFPKEEIPLNKVFDFKDGWIDLPQPTGKIADAEYHIHHNF